MGKKTISTTTGVTVNVQTNSVTTVKKKISWKTFLALIVLLAGVWTSGIYVGRKSVVEQPPVYVKGDTVTVTVSTPEPVEVRVPCDTMDIIKNCVKNGKYAEMFPERIVETVKYVPTREDTVKTILRDWATERVYEEKVFDVDTLGTATVKAKVQYNRISYLEAEVVPAVKEVGYVVPPKKFIPAIGAGLSTRPSYMLEGGVFINDKYGAFLMYERDWIAKKNIVGISGIYKF